MFLLMPLLMALYKKNKLWGNIAGSVLICLGIVISLVMCVTNDV